MAPNPHSPSNPVSPSLLTTPQFPPPLRLRVWVSSSTAPYHSIPISTTPSYFHLRNINRLCPSLTPNSTPILVHSLVTSRLDYCNSLLFGLPHKLLHILQLVQKRCCPYYHRNPCHLSHHPRPTATSLAPYQATYSTRSSSIHSMPFITLPPHICLTSSKSTLPPGHSDPPHPSTYTSPQLVWGDVPSCLQHVPPVLKARGGTSLQPLRHTPLEQPSPGH